MLSNAPNGLAQSFEHAYGHYLLASDKFLRSYHLLKKCLKEEFADEISPVLHFLIYFNLSKLRWPLKWYAGEIPEEILKETKHIDLERLIWDRFYEKRSLPVHKVLRALKDEELLERALNNVEEALAEMLSVYEKYKSGSSYIAVPNYTDGLDFNFRLLSSYANGNYLFYDRSGRFKYIIEKAFEGLLLSHATVAYPYRLKSFECSTLRTAVIHIATENLEKLLTKVPNLELQEKGKKDFVKLMQSYFGQFYQTTTFGGTELRSQMSVLLTNHYFRETIQRIFANFSLTCEKILWNKETWQNSLTDSISNFLEVEDFLYWFQLKKFGRFLEKQTILFTYNQLVKLLHISIDRHQSSINKYQHFIESLCKCLAKAYPDNRIKSERLFQKALASSYVDDNDLRFEILYHIFPVVDRSHQLAIIHEAKKRLAQSFDPHFYQELLWRNILDWDDGPYFGQLVRYMATAQNRGSITFNGKDLDMKDVTFYNFCVLTHFLRVPREQISLSSFENLTTIEQWLLDPVGFDYSQFDAGWLRSVGKAAILDLLKGRKEVIDIVERDLTKDFDAKLAEIKYRRLLAPK